MGYLPKEYYKVFKPLVDMFPGEGNSNPLQYCWEDPMHRGGLEGYSPGVTKRGTQQGTQTCAHAHVCWVDKVPLELQVTHISPGNHPWMKTSYVNKFQAAQNSVCFTGLHLLFLLTWLIEPRNWKQLPLFSVNFHCLTSSKNSNKRPKADHTSQSTEAPETVKQAPSGTHTSTMW